MERAAAPGMVVITPRQSQVLELLAQGHTAKEIAIMLKTSYATVKNHLSDVYERFGVHRDVQAIALWDALRAQGKLEVKSMAGRAGRGTDDELTPRQQRILELVAQGYANKQVEYVMHATMRIVKVELGHIFDKLGVGSRTAAGVLWATELREKYGYTKPLLVLRDRRVV